MEEYFNKLYTESKENFYDLILDNLKSNHKMFIVTANPETFSWAEKKENYDKLLKDNITYIIPDGISIVKASKMLGYNAKERITGIDLASELLKIANDNKYTLALIGASEEVNRKLIEIIKEGYTVLENKTSW